MDCVRGRGEVEGMWGATGARGEGVRARRADGADAALRAAIALPRAIHRRPRRRAAATVDES